MGEGADRTAIVVTNAKTHKIHAIFKSNTIQYKETFRFVYTLFYHHIPNSVLIVENNIDTLIEYFKNSSLKPFLYYEFPKDKKKDKWDKGLKKSESSSIVYGLNTTSSNRPKYFDILFEYVSNYKDYICVREMIEEIETLEYKSQTRIEAVSGKHDDVILSYLLGEYVMREGTNKARFGLFYADGFGKEYNTTDSNVFKKNRRYNQDVDRELYNSPFLNNLLVKQETIEDLDRKWQKMINSGSREESLTYETNIFTGEKDVSGIQTIRPGSFKDLNNYDPYRGLSTEDQFGTGGYNDSLDFMNDLDNGFF